MSNTTDNISTAEIHLLCRKGFNRSKRVFDLFASFTLIILLAPVLMLFPFIIFIITGKNPVYVDIRAITFKHKSFKLYKFRTFIKDPVASPLIKNDILSKPSHKELVFPFGKFLRKTGLDELPQLFNILKGEMSFVGPRPLNFEDLRIMESDYPEIYERRSKIRSLPGLTGYWQIFGNREKGLNNLIELDEYYERNKSFFFDMFIIFLSMPFVFFGKNSDAVV